MHTPTINMSFGGKASAPSHPSSIPSLLPLLQQSPKGEDAYLIIKRLAKAADRDAQLSPSDIRCLAHGQIVKLLVPHVKKCSRALARHNAQPGAVLPKAPLAEVQCLQHCMRLLSAFFEGLRESKEGNVQAFFDTRMHAHLLSLFDLRPSDTRAFRLQLAAICLFNKFGMHAQLLDYYNTHPSLFPKLCDILKQKLLLTVDYMDDFSEAVSYVEFLSDSASPLAPASQTIHSRIHLTRTAGIEPVAHAFADGGLVDYFLSLLHPSAWAGDARMRASHPTVELLICLCTFATFPPIAQRMCDAAAQQQDGMQQLAALVLDYMMRGSQGHQSEALNLLVALSSHSAEFKQAAVTPQLVTFMMDNAAKVGGVVRGDDVQLL